MPILTAHTTYKARCTMLCVTKPLASEATHQVGMYGRKATLLYLTQIELGKVSTAKVRKTVWRGNGLLSFQISLYAFESDWSVRADWISSSNKPSRESMLKTSRESFKDVFPHLWKKLAFLQYIGLLLIADIYQQFTILQPGCIHLPSNADQSLLNTERIDIVHCLLSSYEFESLKLWGQHFHINNFHIVTGAVVIVRLG